MTDNPYRTLGEGKAPGSLEEDIVAALIDGCNRDDLEREGYNLRYSSHIPWGFGGEVGSTSVYAVLYPWPWRVKIILNPYIGRHGGCSRLSYAHGQQVKDAYTALRARRSAAYNARVRKDLRR